MNLLATDRAPPRRWVGSNRSLCYFVNKTKDSGRVHKSHAPPPDIKDWDARKLDPESFVWKREETGEGSKRMVVDMNTTSNTSSPITFNPQRPTSLWANSNNSGSSRSSSSTCPSGTSRPTSLGRMSLSFQNPKTPSPLHIHRGSPSSRGKLSQRTPSPAYDQNALTSPMRTLLLTMPPILDDNVESATRTKQPQTVFYTWENLPPRDLMAACISEFYGDRGLTKFLCPLPQSEASEMFQSIYAGSNEGDSPGSRQVSRSTKNCRLCQVLLLAATGSQHLEESVSNEARGALFTSGKWYLDMAFGRDANDLQRMRANLLVGLYFMFEKSIAAMEYLSECNPSPDICGLSQVGHLSQASFLWPRRLVPLGMRIPFPPPCFGGC
jgi:hypothetical protein